MLVLTINFFAYLIWFLRSFFKAHRKFTIYNVSVLWITIIAFMGLYSVANGQYGNIYWSNGVFYVKPYLYCFASFYLLLLPFRRWNKRVEIEQLSLLNNKKLLLLFKLLFILYSLLASVSTIVLLRALASGHSLSDLYMTYHEEGGSFLGYSNIESKINWLFTPFHDVFYWFVIVVSLLHLSKNRSHSFLCWSLIILTFGIDIINYMTRAARGEFLYLALKLILVMLVLWPYLSSYIKRRIVKYSAYFFAFFVLYTVAVSISRFDDSSSSEGSKNSIIRYFGEGFPNLSNQVWDKVLRHPMGTRMAPFVAGSVIGNDVVSVADRQEFWEYFTGIPMLNFKTIYGDFYVEFGEYGAFIAIVVLFLIFIPFFSKPMLKYYSLPIFGVYIDIIIMSPLYFSYSGTGQFKKFIFCLAGTAFLYFYMYLKRGKNSKSITKKVKDGRE